MPGWSHRNGERRDTAVLGHLLIGPGQDQTPVGLVGVAGPHLVAGDHVVVTLAVGPGTQRGQVGPGVRLAEPLTPTVAPVDDAGEEPALDLLAAVLEDALDQIAQARARWRPGRGQLLVDDDLVDGRTAPGHQSPWATTSRRSRRRRATGARPPRPPSSRRRSTRWAGRDCCPPTTPAAAAGTRPRSVASRKSIATPDALVVQAPGPYWPRSRPGARHREQRPPEIEVGRALPGVADPAVHLDCRLADHRGPPGRSRPWPPPPQPVRRRGASSSTAQAAWSVTLRAPSAWTIGVCQQVLDGLKRTDGHAVLPALSGVVVASSTAPASHRPGRRMPKRGPSAVHRLQVVRSIDPAAALDGRHVGRGSRPTEGRVRSIPAVAPSSTGPDGDRQARSTRPAPWRRPATSIADHRREPLPSTGRPPSDRSACSATVSFQRPGGPRPTSGVRSAMSRAEERNIGHAPTEFFGHDCRLHPRCHGVPSAVGAAELPPSRGSDRGVELGRTFGVAELPDRRGADWSTIRAAESRSACCSAE